MNYELRITNVRSEVLHLFRILQGQKKNKLKKNTLFVNHKNIILLIHETNNLCITFFIRFVAL